MITALKFLYTLSLSLWVGSIFFLAMIAAPSIFKVLQREQAGDVVSEIFPKYYMLAYVCGTVLLVSSIALIYLDNHLSNLLNAVKIGAIVVMIGLAVYAGEINRPQAHEVRTQMRAVGEGGPEYTNLHNKFRGLHRTSAITNSAIFILGIALLLLSAYTNRE
ncbi:MAG: DUF4149 domain-containing protein [Thermodesulfobacteriota bacterium]